MEFLAATSFFVGMAAFIVICIGAGMGIAAFLDWWAWR